MAGGGGGGGGGGGAKMKMAELFPLKVYSNTFIINFSERTTRLKGSYECFC